MQTADAMVEMVSPSGMRVRNKTITLVGCGSGACNMVQRIMEKGFQKEVKTLLLSSDDDKASDNSGKFMGLSRESIRTSPHPEVRWSHYEDTLDEMVTSFEDSDITVFLFSLGGTVGTALAPMAAKAAFLAGSSNLGFAIMPFSVEKERYTRATHSLPLIKEELPNTVVLENDKLQKIAGNRSIDTAFSVMDNLIREKLYQMIDSMSFIDNYVDEEINQSDLKSEESSMNMVLEVA